MDLNKVMLIGRMTQDPQNRTTTSGQNLSSFGLATNRRWKNNNTGEMQEDAQFHNIVAWGKLGEICAQYMQKGMRLFVEGRIQNRSWDDQQTGQKKYRTEIIAENIIMLDSKNNSGGSGYNQSASYGAASQPASNSGQNSNSNPNQQNQNEANIPASEQIPTINVDDDQEEVKIEDIPF